MTHEEVFNYLEEMAVVTFGGSWLICNFEGKIFEHI